MTITGCFINKLREPLLWLAGILIITILPVNNVYATEDSLVTLLDVQTNDTNKIRIYYALTEKLIYTYPDKAIEYGNTGLALSRSISFSKGEALMLKQLGVTYMYNGEYDKALDHLLKSLETFRSIADTRGIAAVTGDIGIVFWYQENAEKALEYYHKALEQYRILGDSTGIATQYNNLGLVHADLNDYEKAIELYQKSLNIYEVLGDEQSIAKRLNNIAIIHEEKGETEKAFQYYQKALELREKVGDKNGMVITLGNLGDLISKTGSFERSLPYLEKSLALSQEINFLEGQRHAYEYLAEHYARTGNYKQAYAYHQQFTGLNDSIRSIEVHDRITEMEARYQNERKEKKIALLEEDRAKKELGLVEEKAANRQKTIIIMALIGGFLIVSLVAFMAFRNYRQKQWQKLRTYAREIDLLRANIDMQLTENNKQFRVQATSEDINRYLIDPLSDRELEILQQVATGKTNKQIAETIYVSENTVKYHLKNIYLKLDVRNRTEALSKAGAMNLLNNHNERS